MGAMNRGCRQYPQNYNLCDVSSMCARLAGRDQSTGNRLFSLRVTCLRIGLFAALFFCASKCPIFVIILGGRPVLRSPRGGGGLGQRVLDPQALLGRHSNPPVPLPGGGWIDE